LAIEEKLAPRGLSVAMMLDRLGRIARDRGDNDKAGDYFREAVSITKRLAPESAEYAESLAALGGVMRDEKHLDSATEMFQQALSALESQIGHLGGSSGVRSGFRAKHADSYVEYLDLLMQQGRRELAFKVLERSRARALLETLAESHIDIRHGTDAALFERERSLQASIRAKLSSRMELMEGEHPVDLAAVNKAIDESLSQYDEVKEQIRNSAPGYAALTQPQPLGAKQAQEQLLDADTLLLEFALGKERSYVFALTPTSLVAYELPKRSEIEGTARHVYDLLTTHNRAIKEETNVQRNARLVEGEQEYRKTSAVLSQMILGPVVSQLERKRLLIVGDGTLQYIPFAVLPVPSTSPSENPSTASPSTAPKLLVAEHEIVNLPSASVLALLRRREENGRQSAHMKSVVVLADPVFDKDDSRVAKSENRASSRKPVPRDNRRSISHSPGDDLTRSVSDLGLRTTRGSALPRLVFTRQEAAKIMEATPAGQGREALDFQASRATVIRGELAEYRIVHFATHGLLDNEHPELSGLVLSMVDRVGDPQNGFLDLEDIYNLNLPVDLVVLSACETGLGKEVTGEGLVGLTRGFMYAGASRVVASLWKVDDVATAELMGKFYRGMLREGLRPAASLRQAQMEMQKQKRWADPYFWGAFTIQGEWR
jgi:CHAT domain-containing protein